MADICRGCHKAIMVTTRRAHCHTFCIFRSLLMQFEHSFELGGEFLYVGRLLFALHIAHCSQFKYSSDSTMQFFLSPSSGVVIKHIEGIYCYTVVVKKDVQCNIQKYINIGHVIGAVFTNIS